MQARGQPRPRGAAAPGCGQAVPRRATGCRVPAVFLPPRGLAVCRSILPSSALHCPALQCAVLQLHRPAPFCSVLRCSACWRAAGRGRGLGDGLRSALGSPAPVPARALRRARAARFVLNQPEVLLDNAEMSWHTKKKSGILTTRGISTAALIASGPPSAAPAAALCSALRAQAGEQRPNPTCCSENKNALYFCLF